MQKQDIQTVWTAKGIGVYFHIPFCAGKCPYCDFYSVAGNAEQKDAYTRQLVQEFQATVQEAGRKADTVYLGGGTPVLLGLDNLCRVLEAVRPCLLPDAEVTIEANPNAVSLPLLSGLQEAGINRISFGMQSGVPEELQALGRRHSVEQVVEAVRMARCAGIDNISLDLMLGIPYQTADSLEQTLEIVSSLAPAHVSAYLLKIEQETPFGQNGIEALCPDEDQTADLYLQAAARLEQMGLFQYEISNFSRPGKQSRHNLKYWRCEEYAGIGVAAHSYLDGVRYAHQRNLQVYLQDWKADWTVTDASPGGFGEYAMLRLRLTEGLPLKECQRRFGVSPESLVRTALPYVEAGLITVSNHVLALTRKGFLVSNRLIVELLSTQGVQDADLQKERLLPI
ncbi:MAG TPA: radical SAM family heme chaperone HemW [Firmicutes bacterium]|nr:radical SAM family heme chaperone HemW [Bacillota bacterium]